MMTTRFEPLMLIAAHVIYLSFLPLQRAFSPVTLYLITGELKSRACADNFMFSLFGGDSTGSWLTTLN